MTDADQISGRTTTRPPNAPGRPGPLAERITESLRRAPLELVVVYRHTRGRGNTSVLLEAAKSSGAIVMFAKATQARKAYHLDPGLRGAAEAVGLLYLHDAIAGSDRPLLIDNSLWGTIFAHMDGQRSFLEMALVAIRETELAHDQIRQTLATLDAAPGRDAA